MPRSGILTLRLAAVVCLLLFPAAGAVALPAKGHRRSSPQQEFQAAKAVIEGMVIAIADGDTLDVLDAAKETHRIRLLGIDTPEKGQPYGKVARQALLERVIGKRVSVLVQTRDQYGRAVGKVLLGSTDINLEMVREGLAWHYKHYAGDQFPGDPRVYAQAESEARSARRGLWNDHDPEAPWEWRRSHRRRWRP